MFIPWYEVWFLRNALYGQALLFTTGGSHGPENFVLNRKTRHFELLLGWYWKKMLVLPLFWAHIGLPWLVLHGTPISYPLLLVTDNWWEHSTSNLKVTKRKELKRGVKKPNNWAETVVFLLTHWFCHIPPKFFGGRGAFRSVHCNVSLYYDVNSQEHKISLTFIKWRDISRTEGDIETWTVHLKSIYKDKDIAKR